MQLLTKLRYLVIMLPDPDEAAELRYLVIMLPDPDEAAN